MKPENMRNGMRVVNEIANGAVHLCGCFYAALDTQYVTDFQVKKKPLVEILFFVRSFICWKFREKKWSLLYHPKGCTRNERKYSNPTLVEFLAMKIHENICAPLIGEQGGKLTPASINTFVYFLVFIFTVCTVCVKAIRR